MNLLDANAIARHHGIDELRQALDASAPQPKARGIKFTRTSTTVIMATKYPPLRAVVGGYLYECKSAL